MNCSVISERAGCSTFHQEASWCDQQDRWAADETKPSSGSPSWSLCSNKQVGSQFQPLPVLLLVLLFTINTYAEGRRNADPSNPPLLEASHEHE